MTIYLIDQDSASAGSYTRFPGAVTLGVRDRMLVVFAHSWYSGSGAALPYPQVSTPSYSGGGTFTSLGYQDLYWVYSDAGWKLRIFAWYMEDPTPDDPADITACVPVSPPAGPTQYVETTSLYFGNARYAGNNKLGYIYPGSTSSTLQTTHTDPAFGHEGAVVGNSQVGVATPADMTLVPSPQSKVIYTSIASSLPGERAYQIHWTRHTGADWKEQTMGVNNTYSSYCATIQVALIPAQIV